MLSRTQKGGAPLFRISIHTTKTLKVINGAAIFANSTDTAMANNNGLPGFPLTGAPAKASIRRRNQSQHRTVANETNNPTSKPTSTPSPAKSQSNLYAVPNPRPTAPPLISETAMTDDDRSM
jgi:hypothetical protein